MNKFSILIPSLGHIEKLKCVLSSIEKQICPVDWEIETIVVVNGCDIQHFNSIQEKFSRPNVHLVFEPIKGVNRARNTAIKIARGELLYFLDDDCELQDLKTVQNYIHLHLTNLNICAFGGGYLIRSPQHLFDRIYNEIQMRWLFSQKDKIYSKIKPVQYLLGGNFSIKMSILQDYHLRFNESFTYGGTETEFFEILKLNNLSVALVELDILHHTNESFLSVCQKIYKQGQGRAKILNLHHEKSKVTIAEIKKVQSAPVYYFFWHLFFNYIFWLGYYVEQKKLAYILLHILKDIFGYLNYIRFEILNKINRH